MNQPNATSFPNPLSPLIPWQLRPDDFEKVKVMQMKGGQTILLPSGKLGQIYSGPAVIQLDEKQRVVFQAEHELRVWYWGLGAKQQPAQVLSKIWCGRKAEEMVYNVLTWHRLWQQTHEQTKSEMTKAALLGNTVAQQLLKWGQP